MKPKSLVLSALILASTFALNSCSAPTGEAALSSSLSPAEFQKALQEKLIAAKSGSVIELPEGRFQFDKTLSLTANGVTIRGKGMAKTVLAFKGQTAGSAGMLVKANDFTIEDVAIEDAAGDGLKTEGSTNVTIRRVRVEWTAALNEKNGPYGIYPVTSKNVLIEDSFVKGAADAGFYLGQSENAIMRRNRAEGNVAGFEVENCKNVDVYENTATNNSGGILVFNLPDLPVQGGEKVRVYNNQVVGNNAPNVAPKSQTVYNLPSGLGVSVMAIKNVEVFNNTIKDNNTANMHIISYLAMSQEIKDKTYNPFVSNVYVHDNQFGGSGKNPDARLESVLAVAKAVGQPMPDILYDGMVEPGATDAKICLQNNGEVTFANFDAANQFKKVSRDAKKHQCTLPALTAITLPQDGTKSMTSAAGGGK